MQYTEEMGELLTAETVVVVKQIVDGGKTAY